MATKNIQVVKINNLRVVFGNVNGKYMLAMPDIEISSYMDPFQPTFVQDNIIKLSNQFKSKGQRNIALCHLIIHTITELSKEGERKNTDE